MRTLLALSAAALTSAGSPAATPLDVAGTYRLQGEGRVEARPFPPQEAELHLDAMLTAGTGDEVHVHLTGPGLTCDLTGTLDTSGLLMLARGQRCASDLGNDALDGRLEAQLVTGSGRVRGEELELEVSFTVSGAVRLKEAELLHDLGARLSLPGVGRDPFPVHGEGRARASGRRDRSRAISR